MDEQLRLKNVIEAVEETDWLTKYPPTRVRPDILGDHFDTVAIPGDGVAIVIESADDWIDRQIRDTWMKRHVTLGPVLISWGVLAVVRSWNSVSRALIDHACCEIEQTCLSGCDLNSRFYPRKEAKIESRIVLGSGAPLLISTYIVGGHTEVKLARDVELSPRYGCIE